MAYDPDILVRYKGEDSKALEAFNRQVVPHTEILDGFSEDCSVKYGVGLPEIMQRFAYDEMRFKRREPVRMVFPTARGLWDCLPQACLAVCRQV
jgi:hypothetical protein